MLKYLESHLKNVLQLKLQHYDSFWSTHTMENMLKRALMLVHMMMNLKMKVTCLGLGLPLRDLLKRLSMENYICLGGYSHFQVHMKSFCTMVSPQMTIFECGIFGQIDSWHSKITNWNKRMFNLARALTLTTLWWCRLQVENWNLIITIV